MNNITKYLLIRLNSNYIVTSKYRYLSESLVLNNVFTFNV